MDGELASLNVTGHKQMEVPGFPPVGGLGKDRLRVRTDGLEGPALPKLSMGSSDPVSSEEGGRDLMSLLRRRPHPCSPWVCQSRRVRRNGLGGGRGNICGVRIPEVLWRTGVAKAEKGQLTG